MTVTEPQELQAQSGADRLQWNDCHIPHIDTAYPCTRSAAERLAASAVSGEGTKTTPLPTKGNHLCSKNSACPTHSAIERRTTGELTPVSGAFSPSKSTPSPPKVTRQTWRTSPLTPRTPQPGEHRANAKCAEIRLISLIPQDIHVLIVTGDLA